MAQRCYTCWTIWESEEKACPSCGGRRMQQYTPSPLEDEVVASIQSRLAELEPDVIKALGAIVKKQMPNETHLISFEGQPGSFRDSLAIRWDPIDAELGQLDGGQKLFRDEPSFIEDRFYKPPYDEIEVPSIAFHAMPVWFSNCWITAGGRSCKYPAFLEEQGLHNAYDLLKQQWDFHGERWPET